MSKDRSLYISETNRKRRARQLGLPETTSWAEIDAENKRLLKEGTLLSVKSKTNDSK